MGEINDLHNYTLIIMPTSIFLFGYAVLLFKLLSCQNVYYLPVPINLCLECQTFHPQEIREMNPFGVDSQKVSVSAPNLPKLGL
jgi:hypothetical protein